MSTISTKPTKAATPSKKSKPVKKAQSTQVKKSSAVKPGSKDVAEISKDAGVQPNQNNVPNFQSWASPNAASKTSELKRLSGDTLARRSKGDDVKQLQNHLNQGGSKLEVDGKFGPLTQKAVRKFQRQNNLTVDGKVGPETMGALNKGLSPEAAKKPEPVKKNVPAPVAKTEPVPKKEEPAPVKKNEPVPKKDEPAPVKKNEPAPDKKEDPAPVNKTDPNPVKKAEGLPELAGKNLTPQEKYDHYAAMVKAAGGKLDDKNPTVLGLRGLGTDGKRHDSGKNTGSGDDTFVVLGHDKAGKPTVTELKGATHAAVKQGSVPGGVAQLRPGNYEATRRRDYKGAEAWALNGGGNVPVYRDGNRDGFISESEKARAVANNTQGDGILFHKDRGVSIGCQTLPLDVLHKLKDTVGGGNFHYTLLDANRPQ